MPVTLIPIEFDSDRTAFSSVEVPVEAVFVVSTR